MPDSEHTRRVTAAEPETGEFHLPTTHGVQDLMTPAVVEDIDNEAVARSAEEQRVAVDRTYERVAGARFSPLEIRTLEELRQRLIEDGGVMNDQSEMQFPAFGVHCAELAAAGDFNAWDALDEDSGIQETILFLEEARLLREALGISEEEREALLASVAADQEPEASRHSIREAVVRFLPRRRPDLRHRRA